MTNGNLPYRNAYGLEFIKFSSSFCWAIGVALFMAVLPGLALGCERSEYPYVVHIMSVFSSWALAAQSPVRAYPLVNIRTT